MKPFRYCLTSLRRPEIEAPFETWERSISLQLNRRRSAGRGLERRPNHSAGGQQADSRHPGRM
jgi:hypothetical protein